MPTSATSVLDSILAWPVGRARLAMVSSIPGALADLRAWLAGSDREARLVSEVFERLPPPDALLSAAVGHLAEVALALWPDWRDALISPAVSTSWLKAVSKLCEVGKAPLPNGFARSIQAAQLALAIGPRELILALCVEDEDPAPGRLLGLARAAEWLARETSARLLVIVPDQLGSSIELDAINFDAIRWPRSTEPSIGQRLDDWTPRIWPILGRPHPDSPGEQALARRLAGDAELAGLFAFNVYARVRSDQRYLVDLLWADGKVVVEVDGYLYHHDRESFSRDRRRDYQLLISGHLVLRLPHDEVVDDVELAVEKIRDVVRFRRAESPPTRLVIRP
jgi:very-short-patch-repair endonuclease